VNARHRLSLICVVAALVVAPSYAAAQSSRVSTLPTSSFSTSALATPAARAATTAELVARINAMSMRPTPSTPPSIVRSDTLWVPDRYVTVPGVTQLVLVPGHWERQLENGRSYAPPLVIATPENGVVVIPAGERPSIDHRVGP
jgi:hypothetical protein